MFVPVMATPEIVNGAAPVLLSWTTCVELVTPTACEANSTVVGAKVTVVAPEEIATVNVTATLCVSDAELPVTTTG